MKRKREGDQAESSDSPLKGGRLNSEAHVPSHNPTRADKGKDIEIADENDDDSAAHSIAQEEAALRAASRQSVAGTVCPYLDTVNRALLDFDFEKICSVSSTNINVYCCLACGKYFQGRGRTSHAYFHALDADHHVFINLHTKKVYCLPDGYEVIDGSLDDVKYVLHPTYTRSQVAQLDKSHVLSTAYDGTTYLPGFIGLNNIKRNDFMNAVLQCLVHVPTIRDFFMFEDNYASKTQSAVVHTFGELVRKIWNPRSFKAHVSPHEVLQAISTASDKRFRIGEQGDPIDFLAWFLNELHRDLGGTKKPGSSIIHTAFQGGIKKTTFQGFGDPEAEAKATIGATEEEYDAARVRKTETLTPFLFLSLEIPPNPVFAEDQDKNVIPQVPLFSCLAKFDGETETISTIKQETAKYIIKKLPRYLILHLKRFYKNQWFTEKNTTIVNFPVKNLEMRPYTEQAHTQQQLATKYNLVANLCHEGLYGKGIYKVHLPCKANEQWFEIQDLLVKDTLPQLVSLSETYIQIYERKEN